MTKRYIIFGISLFLLCTTITISFAQVRLKDMAVIRDQREVQLIGYGLVVGLNGTGDGKNTQFTIRMIGNMMKRMGVEVPATSIKVKNVAAVMVTATVSPYVKSGGAFDVTVSSLGDASSLEGGTLLMTQLTGPDGLVYASAQGAISVGGSNRNYGGGGIVENIELVGRVSDGGILDHEFPTISTEERSLMVNLRSPDYTTAYRVATAINETFLQNIANPRDAGSIIINVPEEYVQASGIVRFISEMEAITFVPDEKAKVIINERTGTIVAGSNVSLSPVAIMHGTLSLVIEEPGAAGQAQQAAPGLPGAEPVGDRMVTLNETANVGEVAKALNLLGATPRDLIAIFQALKSAGSLRAELVII
ncbi:MAG: flagellar basal body P-ring protein FlgI [Candidatus Latescibacteria bacterium]|nr:flagellar basal body P-ring protein FlgI [Candidatus Latescibacterota bacterium]